MFFLVLAILLIFFYFLFATENIYISYCYCFAGPCIPFFAVVAGKREFHVCIVVAVVVQQKLIN